MKALLISIAILNGPPHFFAYAEQVMPYEECLEQKKNIESVPTSMREIDGVPVISRHIECQPLSDDDLKRFEKEFGS